MPFSRVQLCILSLKLVGRRFGVHWYMKYR